jgi:putative transposase
MIKGVKGSGPKLKPNTFSQLYVHFVFAVKYRAALIAADWEEVLHKYITGITQNNGHKMIAINSAEDHLHMFVGLNPKQSISELMRLVKGDSAEFVNRQKFTRQKFRWQEGYGAFTHSRSDVDRVAKYIFNQKEHHKLEAFNKEYIVLLNEAGIEYDEKYLFHDPE